MPEELKVIMTGESGGLIDNLKRSGTALKGFSDDVEEGAKKTKTFKNTLTELRSGVELVEKGFREIKQIYKETVQVAIDQAMAQKDLARQMGATVEEAGILKEVSDDLRVSQGTLVMAFKELNNAGIQPTFENLIKIAREYQSLPTSVAKNKFAFDMFGRAGIEMQKILDTDINSLQEMGKAAMDSGKILSGPVVDMMEGFRKKIDDTGDSIEGLKIQLGVFFALLVEQAGLGPTSGLATHIKVFNEYTVALQKGIITQKQFDDIQTKTTAGTMSEADAEKWLTKQIGLSTSGITASHHPMQLHTANLAKDTRQLWDHTYGMQQANVDWDEYNRLVRQLPSALASVESAQKSLADVQANWNKSVGQDSLGYLKDWVYNYGPKYTEGLKANDEVWGTDSAVQFARNQALKAANMEYAKTGDLAEYKTKLTEIKDTYGPMDEAIKTATADLLTAKGVLDSIQSKIVTIKVYTEYITGSPPGISGNVEHKKRQYGGNVFPGEIYQVGELEPEWFVSNSAGRILTQRQFANMSMNHTPITVNQVINGSNAAQVKQAAKDGLLAAMRAKGKK